MMATPVRRRTRARELALQFLYSYEMRGEESMADLDSFVEHHTKTGEAATNEPPMKTSHWPLAVVPAPAILPLMS